MTLSDSQLQGFKEASKLVRAGRKVEIYVLSGVNVNRGTAISGSVANLFDNRIADYTEVWVAVSGVVSAINRPVKSTDGGLTYLKETVFSFDYDEIRGYDHSKKMRLDGIVFEINRKDEDRWGSYLTHINFHAVAGR